MNVGYNPHLGYESNVVRDYKRMVHSVANKFRGHVGHGLDYDDLVSVGTIGLIEAFRNYDPDRFDGKVTAFSTYAFPMIQWSIQRFLRDKRNTVRVPRSIQDKATAIQKQNWEQESEEKIAEINGWKLSEVQEVKRYLDGWSVVSLDQTIANDEDISLLDTIPSQSDLTGIDVQEFLLALPPAERTIISMRMAGCSQKEIGKQIRKSQAQVSRVLLQIGEKYMRFQAGTLRKGDVQMSRVRASQAEAASGIEWFIDEGVTTNPTIGINAQGIHFNRRAIHDMGAKKGQCVQVGFDSAENRLLLKVGDNGLQLRAASGDQTGSLRVINKRLAGWLSQKHLPLKRYALHADRDAGIHYVQLDRHA